MLAVLKKTPQRKKYKDPDDIIVTKYETIVEVIDQNTMTSKRVAKQVNITRLVNETKKLVKQNAAAEKINELKEILLKEDNK